MQLHNRLYDDWKQRAEVGFYSEILQGSIWCEVTKESKVMAILMVSPSSYYGKRVGAKCQSLSASEEYGFRSPKITFSLQIGDSIRIRRTGNSIYPNQAIIKR